MDKQIQKAGDNAQQIQATTVVVNNGIDEKRTREIFSEMFALERVNYTQEAIRIAENRVYKFQKSLIPRIEAIEGASEAFADPKFQFLLRDAQRTAAETERESDYDLLTELLVCHIQKGDNRKNSAGIGRAISIVDEIDNDALCGLTVLHVINRFIPTTGIISEGLGALNDLYSKIIYDDLPKGVEWLEHLDVLGAVRISSIASMKKMFMYMTEKLNGYICVGIAIDSEAYNQAKDILNSVEFDETSLVKNELLDGYVRIPVSNKENLADIVVLNDSVSRKIMEHEVEALEKVWDLYVNDSTLMNQVKYNFEEKWDSYPLLKSTRLWWDQIDVVVDITHVGNVLAHTNAKRCDSDVPDLI